MGSTSWDVPGVRMLATANPTLSGGDKALIHALWPIIRYRQPGPAERFTRASRCADCGINAGKGWETVGLNRASRCEACERFYQRHGPALRVSREDAERG